MTYDPDHESPQNVKRGFNGPNVALIIGGLVALLALIFVIRNGGQTKLDFLLFTKTTTVRASIITSLLLGALLSNLFGMWWRRRRQRTSERG